MHKKLFFLYAQSNDGLALLEEHIKPLCMEYDLELILAPPDADRMVFGKAARTYPRLILDATPGPGHIYGKLYPLPMGLANIALVSRKPLPRNLVLLNGIAPPLGHELTNLDLAKWIKNWLQLPDPPSVLEMGYFRAIRNSIEQHNKDIAFRTGVFVSHRGHQRSLALQIGEAFSERWRMPFRVVMKGEYAEDNECMSQQMMWSILANLELEVKNAFAFLVVNSPSYPKSFWAMSELFISQRYRHTRRKEAGQELIVSSARDPGEPVGAVLEPDGMAVRRYRLLVREGDARTSTAERLRPTSGFRGMLAKAMYFLQGYRLDPDDWWNTILLPCQNPECNHAPDSLDGVNLEKHLDLAYYGYFPIRARLRPGERAEFRCPICRKMMRISAQTLTRHLWVPGPMFQAWDGINDFLREEPVLVVSA